MSELSDVITHFEYSRSGRADEFTVPARLHQFFTKEGNHKRNPPNRQAPLGICAVSIADSQISFKTYELPSNRSRRGDEVTVFIERRERGFDRLSVVFLQTPRNLLTLPLFHLDEFLVELA